MFNTFSIFFPALYLTHDFSLSAKYAVPVFCILASSFIINDINDVTRDEINNPHRVLPENEISINLAIVLYYIFLALSLLSLRTFIPLKHAFIYIVYLVLATNYDYIIRGFPYLKNLYVSIIAAIHFAILYTITSIDILILISLILNVLSKEIYMDVRDMRGDGDTLVRLLGVREAGRINIALQILLVVLLSIFAYQTFTLIHCVVMMFVILTFVANIFLWLKYNVIKLKTITNITIAQNIIIYGLII